MAFFHFPLCSVKGDVSLYLFPVVPRVVSTKGECGHQDYPGCCPATPAAFWPLLSRAARSVWAHTCWCVWLVLITSRFADAALSPGPGLARSHRVGLVWRWAQHVPTEVTYPERAWWVPWEWTAVLLQSLSCVWIFGKPWTAACQTPLFFTVSWSLFKFMSIESVILTISFSVTLFSFGLQSFLIRVFPMSQLLSSSGQSTGASTSAAVLPMNI